MKIIHLVLGKANPERMNGVNKVVHKLAGIQTNLGAQVELWGISNDLQHNYPPRNFATKLFQQHPEKWTIDRQLVKAIRNLPKETLIHFHGAFLPEFYWVHRQLIRHAIPYVVTPHGAFTPGAMKQNPFFKAIYFYLFEKSILNRAHAVQLLGQLGYSHLEQLAENCHRILIPNGQDLNDLPDLKRPKNEVIQFGFCGRLDCYHKGLDLLLEGFAGYRNRGGEGILNLIGDGRDLKLLRQLAMDLEIAEEVFFHGARFGYQKFQMLNQSDIFIHTSRMEGFPMAVLEAAGMGIPCLLSEATNMTTYLQDYQAGLALTENTSEKITEALLALDEKHQQGALSQLGVNARQMVAKEFNWEDIAAQLLQIYQQEKLEINTLAFSKGNF